MAKKLKWNLILMSLLYLALGIFLLMVPGTALNVVCYALGGVVLACAAVQLVRYFVVERGVFQSQLTLISGLVCLALGAFLIIRSDVVVRVLPIVFGLFVIFDSLGRIQNALELRRCEYSSWKVFLLLAVLSVVLGIVMVVDPFGTMETLVMAIGVILIVEGAINLLSALYTVLALRRFAKLHPETQSMLEDLTGISARTVPLDQRDVMSLFAGTQALGISPEDIGGCRLGCLGIPEFGTDFAMQMLIDTKPKYFSDLVRIAGLSHGTDVWLGNAQVLIQNGTATISTAICTRDDIMIYLIGKGVESGLAFTIMESVRKGKGLREEWIQTMKEHDVPDWYIWSCKLIKYMFPKAHAAAYVMMAYRIAWYKVFHPLAYYAAFFSIRATSFSYELMCMGKERLEYYMAEIRKKGDEASKKEQDTLKDMRIVQEMYARGFDFVPIDLYKAKAHRFQIIGDKLMPALDTIEGLGDKAAEAVVDAAAKGRFLSKDDFRDRTKVSKTVIDLMDDMDLFGDIPQSNQMSLFDFTG